MEGGPSSQEGVGGSGSWCWDPAICWIPTLVSNWHRAAFGYLYLLSSAPNLEVAENRVDPLELLQPCPKGKRFPFAPR